MDIHKVSDLPERLTVVELGRRRRWSEEERNVSYQIREIRPGPDFWATKRSWCGS